MSKAYHAAHGSWSDEMYMKQLGDMNKALIVERWIGVTGVYQIADVEIAGGVFRFDGLTKNGEKQDGRTFIVPHDLCRDLGRRLIRVERDIESGERRTV